MPTIVYEKPKVIYCAVEKCAITRLIGYFGTTYLQEGNEVRDQAEQIFYPAIETFKSNLPVSNAKDKYPDYFVFSFIRNPFDRVVSNYHFNRGRWIKRAADPKSKISHLPTFTEYCIDMDKWNVLQPLSYHINTEIDFIGKVENFKQDFDKLHEMLKISVMCDPFGNHPLDRIVNRSNREKDYRVYYDNDAREAIENRFSEDLKRFNYSFD